MDPDLVTVVVLSALLVLALVNVVNPKLLVLRMAKWLPPATPPSPLFVRLVNGLVAVLCVVFILIRLL